MEPVEGLTVTLYSKNGVTLDLDCDETSTPTNVTRFQVAALQSNELFYRAFSVCLDSSVEYQLLLEYTTFFPVEWLFDSVSSPRPACYYTYNVIIHLYTYRLSFCLNLVRSVHTTNPAHLKIKSISLNNAFLVL